MEAHKGSQSYQHAEIIHHTANANNHTLFLTEEEATIKVALVKHATPKPAMIKLKKPAPKQIKPGNWKEASVVDGNCTCRFSLSSPFHFKIKANCA